MFYMMNNQFQNMNLTQNQVQVQAQNQNQNKNQFNQQYGNNMNLIPQTTEIPSTVPFNPQNEQNILMGLKYELSYISALISRIQSTIESDDKEEKIGETLYNFIIKSIEMLELNNINNKDVTNDIIAQKLTGILLQSESLVDVLSDIDTFVYTMKDLIVRVYKS